MLSLQELLDSKGLTKGELAEKMGVSRKTITRLGDRVTPEVEAALDIHPEPSYVPPVIPLAEKRKEVDEYTKAEIKELLGRRGAYESIPREKRVEVQGRDCETDYEIARSVGLKVYEFNRLIDRYVEMCHG